MTKLPIAALALLAACGPGPVLYTVPPAPSGQPVSIAFRTVEVAEVSLPLYAEAEEIYVAAAGGALTSAPEARWADDPRRAMTLELSRALGEITGARVAAEPWPFEGLADARVTVRADEMVAGADGDFRLTGQYYVADIEGERDRAGRFAVAEPYAAEGGPAAIADARGRAVRDLARLIASEGM